MQGARAAVVLLEAPDQQARPRQWPGRRAVQNGRASQRAKRLCLREEPRRVAVMRMMTRTRIGRVWMRSRRMRGGCSHIPIEH